MRVRRFVCVSGLLALALVLPGSALGAAHPRVVNGHPLEAPKYMAFVAAVTGGRYYNQCGGVAIRPNVLLTAAHCLVNAKTNAYVTANRVFMAFGLDDPIAALDATDPVPGADEGAEFVAPRNYGKLRYGGTVNDVALVRLQVPAPATVSVLPATRARAATTGRPGVVIGWGSQGPKSTAATRSLMRVDLTIQSPSYCAQFFRPFYSSSTLCAESPTQSPCNGDSGGPLLVTGSGGRLYVAGVVTFGIICRGGYPGVFSNVTTGPLARFVRRQAARLQKKADAEAVPAQPTLPPVAGTPPVSR